MAVNQADWCSGRGHKTSVGYIRVVVSSEPTRFKLVPLSQRIAATGLTYQTYPEHFFIVFYHAAHRGWLIGKSQDDFL